MAQKPCNRATAKLRGCATVLHLSRNITVSVPDEVYRRARVHAAEEGRSVSAMVTEYLRSLSEEPGEFARLERLQKATQARITNFDGGDRLTRDEVHDRALR